MRRSRIGSIRRSRYSPPTFTNPALDGWNGLGIAVQAYGKRAIPTLRWLRRLAERSGKRIPVRLVKGAYWDSEIKWAQERALSDYPVFTRKLHTDVSYLACVRLMLSDPKAFYSQFATHNAYAIAAAHVAGGPADVRVPAPAWHGRGAARRGRRRERPRSSGRAASTRRSAATRICSPISCAACWRTAPTPRSSIGSPTTRRRSSEIIRDPVGDRQSANAAARERSRPSCARATSICPSAAAASGLALYGTCGAPRAIHRDG